MAASAHDEYVGSARQGASLSQQQPKEDNWSTSAATCSSGDSSEGRGLSRAHKEQLYDVGAASIKRRREHSPAPSTSGSHHHHHHHHHHTPLHPEPKAASSAHNKKQRLLWTSRLHAKFMDAVKLLSLENAVPTKILQLMDEPEVTREQVASHLQKYRLHLKRMAGLPADAPLNTQTKDLMQVTQNVMASSLPTSVLTGMLAALPLSAAGAAASLQSQVLYQLPHIAGLGAGGALSGLQPLQLFDSKTGMAAAMQQPLLQAFGGNQLMALNLLPMNYNPYGMLVMPGSYASLPAAQLPTPPVSAAAAAAVGGASDGGLEAAPFNAERARATGVV